MAWMDICGGVAAKRHSASPVVTASMDFLHFLHPVRLGEVVTIRAVVTRAFTSSMEVGVTVRGESPITGESRSCCSCYFTFVARPAADHKAGKGTTTHKERVRVPPLIPTSEEERNEFEAAEQRRALRLVKNRPPLPRSSSPVPEDGKRSDASRAEMTQLVLPSHANTTGITFGGQVMFWMESCASLSAMRHMRRLAIIVAADELHFLQPTFIGEAVLIRSHVTRTFVTSLEVAVTVAAENLMTGEKRHCNTAFFTFVAVDESGRYLSTVQVPPLIPSAPSEFDEYHAAAVRRSIRLEHKAAGAPGGLLPRSVSPLPVTRTTSPRPSASTSTLHSPAPE